MIRCDINDVAHSSLFSLLVPRLLLLRHASSPLALQLTWKIVSNAHCQLLGASPGVSSDSDFLFRELARLVIAAFDHEGRLYRKFFIVTYGLQPQCYSSLPHFFLFVTTIRSETWMQGV